MGRRRQQDHLRVRFDPVEWIVVTLILAIAFFAILQVVGEDLRSAALSLWAVFAELVH